MAFESLMEKFQRYEENEPPVAPSRGNEQNNSINYEAFLQDLTLKRDMLDDLMAVIAEEAHTPERGKLYAVLAGRVLILKVRNGIDDGMFETRPLDQVHELPEECDVKQMMAGLEATGVQTFVRPPGPEQQYVRVGRANPYDAVMMEFLESACREEGFPNLP